MWKRLWCSNQRPACSATFRRPILSWKMAPWWSATSELGRRPRSFRARTRSSLGEKLLHCSFDVGGLKADDAHNPFAINQGVSRIVLHVPGSFGRQLRIKRSGIFDTLLAHDL